MRDRHPDRREFLGTLLSLPVALTFGCRSGDDRPVVAGDRTRAEASLESLVVLLGPWRESEVEAAREFARRFVRVEGLGSPLLTEHGPVLESLAQMFPDGSSAVDEVDLRGLPPEESGVLTSLVRQLYSLVEVRFVVSGEPAWGECQTDRTRHTRPPLP